MTSRGDRYSKTSVLIVAAIALFAGPLCTPARGQEVSAQLRELQSAVEALRADLARAHQDSDELRRELQALRQEVTGQSDEQELQAAKINDIEQTKVESGSRYHVRLSGLALFAASLTQGEVDSVDLPATARPPVPGENAGSITAGARQSYVALSVFGPQVGGARSSGEVTLDFFGGFPSTRDGLATGFARLKTLSVGFDWDHAAVRAGHDTLFFSPLSPTSLLTSAYPPMWNAGNLWSWVPEVHAERSFAVGGSSVLMQGGVLDPLTGDVPASEYDRVPTAGERSRTPAVAARVAWQRGTSERKTAIGAAGYYSRQSRSFDRPVNAWAATADWNVPLASRLSLSGEIYRGQAIAGLGGSAGPSVVISGPADASTSTVRPFQSTGGWVQFQASASPVLQFNAAVGSDRSSPDQVSELTHIGVLDPQSVRQNSSAFVNGIYTLRSNLLFSIEYRRLFATTFDGITHGAGHLSFGGGIAF